MKHILTKKERHHENNAMFDSQVDAATEYEVARVGRPKTMGSGPVRNYRCPDI